MHPAAMIWTLTPSPNFLCSDSVLTELPLRSPSGFPEKPVPREGEGGEQENAPAAFQMTGLASWCEHLSTGLLMGVGP